MNNKIKVAIIPTIIAPYRKGFYDRLLDRKDYEVTIFCQKNIKGININCISNQYPNNVKYIDYISTSKGNFSWQFLPFFKLLSDFDVIVMSGNPRVISDFFLGFFLKFTRKPVVLWTMARSYRANKFTQYLRLLWSKLFKFILLYNDSEIKYLRKKGFIKQNFVAINNGLDQKLIDSIVTRWNSVDLDNWLIYKGLKGKKIFLSSARLESKNNFEIVIKSLPLIKSLIPNIHWLLIGDGSQRDYLKVLAKEYKVLDNITFCGQIFNEEDLAPYFLSSSVFVHPAAIGLSILHAFGYGLPVITHGLPYLHGPEYCAFEEGRTGVNFEINDHISLSNKILNLINDEKKILFMKNYNLNITRNIYNTDIMVNRFIEIINNAIRNKNIK